MSRTTLIIALIFLGLCSFVECSKLSKSQEFQLFYDIFKDWSSKFNMKFGIEELVVRFENWKSNYDTVQDLNSKGLSFKLEMNEFAYMSPEEFSALHLGFNPELKAKNTGSLLGSSNDNSTDGDAADDLPSNFTLGKNLSSLPKSVDWRNSGAVTPVRNQGGCGGCWSFAAAGALEGLYAIKTNKLLALSVQQMIDCSSGYGNMGCDGGLMTNAFLYTRIYGLELDSGYEYTASVGDCKQDYSKSVFRNRGYREVPANDSSALKAAVARQPISVGIEASSLTVQLYKSGIISTGCSTNLDHAVLIVGYDTAKNGQEYWIIKNSWGTSWGLGGYFNVAMGTQNNGAGVCGINMMASYPVA